MRIQRFSKTLQNPKIQIKLIFTQFCKGWQFAASLESGHVVLPRGPCLVAR